jgi:phage shock protein C
MADEIKRLYRSRKDKVIAGVCGGIGEYFSIDPVWVRIIFVLLTILHCDWRRQYREEKIN